MKKIRNVVVATQKKNKKLFSAVKNKFLDAKERIKNIDKKKLKRAAGVVGLATFLALSSPQVLANPSPQTTKVQKVQEQRTDEQTEILRNAIISGNLEKAKEAIAKGADVNYVAKERVYSESLLHIAAKKGDLKAVKLLIEHGADVNAKDEFGRTSLHMAAGSGNLEVVKFFIEKGLDVNAKSKSGKTVLHYAAEGGNLEVVKFLVENGADVNAKDKYDATPFDWAIIYGHLEVVKFFVENGANVKREPYLDYLEFNLFWLRSAKTRFKEMVGLKLTEKEKLIEYLEEKGAKHSVPYYDLLVFAAICSLYAGYGGYRIYKSF